jgi:hypothetical protein
MEVFSPRPGCVRLEQSIVPDERIFYSIIQYEGRRIAYIID